MCWLFPEQGLGLCVCLPPDRTDGVVVGGCGSLWKFGSWCLGIRLAFHWLGRCRWGALNSSATIFVTLGEGFPKSMHLSQWLQDVHVKTSGGCYSADLQPRSCPPSLFSPFSAPSSVPPLLHLSPLPFLHLSLLPLYHLSPPLLCLNIS